MRMELDLAGPIKESHVMGSDGRYRWQYIPEKSVAFKIDMERIKQSGHKYADDTAQDISDPLVGMKEGGITYKGKEELNGEPVFLIEGPLAAIEKTEDAVAAKAQIYIGTDGIARRYVIYDDNGDAAIEQIFSNIQQDAGIDDSQFIFSPPEGVEVVDSTEDIINSIGATEGEKE